MRKNGFLTMDTSSGTLGRRASKSSVGMRRQRSLEWRQERGYSSSEEDIASRPVDSAVFASLLAQAQQEYQCLDRSYRSDDTEDAHTTDNPTTPFPTPPPTNVLSPRSPLPMHRQASPFPHENTNTRRIIYATPQDRLRGNNGEVVYASNKKSLVGNNTTLGRSGRRHRGAGGMTSSSSATSCNSCTDPAGRNDISYHPDAQGQRICLNNEVNEESPPEPAPPEVPPRGPSLHATSLRRRPDYALPVDDDGSGQQETFLAQGEYVLSGSPRASAYPARSPMGNISNTNSQHR
ncbi:uncharacterized protein [Atheta coriaria]|uniref:uncharacterized protein n=1 Tax=Dalotia coriaria TaxID=877792 RepID=UPI0031F4768D